MRDKLLALMGALEREIPPGDGRHHTITVGPQPHLLALNVLRPKTESCLTIFLDNSDFELSPADFVATVAGAIYPRVATGGGEIKTQGSICHKAG